MKLFKTFNQLVKLAVAAVVVGSALLIAPGGAAHAAYDVSNEQCIFNSKTRNGVYVFSDINYQGRCSEIGNYFWAQVLQISSDMGVVGNDHASSLKIVGNGNGKQWDVVLYEHSNIGGQSYHTYSSIPDFTKVRMNFGKNLNDQVSSYSVMQWSS